MKLSSHPKNKILAPGAERRCLSCGTREKMRARRYCSLSCRQHLRQKLNMRSGLLKALNTRYATFYFTDGILVLDVLTYGCKDIYSFLYPRSPRHKPADDFCRMANKLGQAWWSVQKQTHKRYLASQALLDRAQKNHVPDTAVRPRELCRPTLIGKSLLRLQLNSSELKGPKVERAIKSAYRRQVMIHHPDQGGDAHAFRTIHKAYQQLMRWAENPTFTRRFGLPDRWSYDGRRNRWVQPSAIHSR